MLILSRNNQKKLGIYDVKYLFNVVLPPSSLVRSERERERLNVPHTRMCQCHLGG